MSLYYSVQGEGPTVVLLHGWALNRHVWVNVSKALAKQYRVLSVDLPGHGRSPSLHPYTLDAVVDAVASVIDSDRIDSGAAAVQGASVIGWSLGGMVAMQLAITYPQKLDKLVTLAASAQFVASEQWPYGVKAEVLDNFNADLLKDHRATILRFLSIQSLGSEYAKTEIRTLKKQLFVDGEPDEEALLGGLAILQTTQLQQHLAAIRCPTLMIVGKRDALVNAEACYRTAKAIEKCEVVTVAEAGHAVFISHPQQFQQSLEAFLCKELL